VLPKRVAYVDGNNKICCGWRQYVCQYTVYHDGANSTNYYYYYYYYYLLAV